MNPPRSNLLTPKILEFSSFEFKKLLEMRAFQGHRLTRRFIADVGLFYGGREEN